MLEKPSGGRSSRIIPYQLRQVGKDGGSNKKQGHRSESRRAGPGIESQIPSHLKQPTLLSLVLVATENSLVKGAW